MPAYASLGSARVVAARITLPPWGAWTADVSLADDEALPAGALTLTIADLSLVGTPVPGRNGPFAGSRSLLLVGGAAGWQRVVTSAFYTKPQGVRLATVLGDVAAAVGERVSLSASFASLVIGPFFARTRGPASQVLAVTTPRQWWVDPLGVTQVGTRPATAITTAFDPVDDGYEPNMGHVRIATEDLAQWQPGATFTHPLLPGAMTAETVTIDMREDGTLRLGVDLA